MKVLHAAFVLTGILALVDTAVGSSRSASRAAAPEAGSPIDPEVLKLREAAWRAYFAGDVATLKAMLPADFIGINMFDGPFVTYDEALDRSRALRAHGGRLVSLEFPETRAQHYGDVIIFYGRYTAVVESGGLDPKTTTLSGRLTELFLRKDGRWIHTGWHLDTASTR